ncbi:MAG: alpha/beta fold hydrolase, partial [Pseudomonadota bacterium]
MLMDVVELFDHLEIDAADVVGFSMGAELALALAVHYPDRVRSLTIAGSGWSPREIVDEYRKWFDILAENAENPDSLRALIEDVPEVIGLPDGAIRTLPMPLVGIIGELDDERPYVERICEVRPEFQPIVLPGLDHLGTWQSPEFPALLERALSGGL